MPRLVELSCGYCIYVLHLKPLKCNKKHFHAIVKVKRFSTFPMGTSGRAAISSTSHYWAVLKNRYLGPDMQINHSDRALHDVGITLTAARARGLTQSN